VSIVSPPQFPQAHMLSRICVKSAGVLKLRYVDL
jgi:hypothetical protein